jgi:hypothetical protein
MLEFQASIPAGNADRDENQPPPRRPRSGNIGHSSPSQWAQDRSSGNTLGCRALQ